MKYKVRPGRPLVTPDGVLWAKPGQLVKLDLENPMVARIMQGRMNALTPAEDAEGEIVPLPALWQERIDAETVKLDRKAPSAMKRKPGRPKGSKNKPKPERLANPEE